MGTTIRRKFIQTTALPCSLEYAKKIALIDHDLPRVIEVPFNQGFLIP